MQTYGLKADTIVGYTFNADNLCPSCMRTTAAFALAPHDEAAFRGRPGDGDTAEQFLDRWAKRDGVNRNDEHSFDSDDFPKVILAVQVDGPEECSRCYSDLINDR